ncbi:hypothetical protein [Aerococcus urinaeequi]|nr:hypothetical protein [Aerococcus urinaeequi]
MDIIRVNTEAVMIADIYRRKVSGPKLDSIRRYEDDYTDIGLAY